MANYEILKSAIQEVVKENGNNEITGALLQQTLLAMVNSLGDNYQLRGVAVPTTNPGVPDQNVFYFATQVGNYHNFTSGGGTGTLSVAEGEVAIFKFNGTSWSKEITGIASKENVENLANKIGKTYAANLAPFVNGYRLTRDTDTTLQPVTADSRYRNLLFPVKQGDKIFIVKMTSSSTNVATCWVKTNNEIEKISHYLLNTELVAPYDGYLLLQAYTSDWSGANLETNIFRYGLINDIAVIQEDVNKIEKEVGNIIFASNAPFVRGYRLTRDTDTNLQPITDDYRYRNLLFPVKQGDKVFVKKMLSTSMNASSCWVNASNEIERITDKLIGVELIAPYDGHLLIQAFAEGGATSVFAAQEISCGMRGAIDNLSFEKEFPIVPYTGEKVALNYFTYNNNLATLQRTNSFFEGMTIFNGLMFVTEDGGYMNIFDIEDNFNKIASFKMSVPDGIPCSGLAFSSQKYDPNDEFPLLYMSDLYLVSGVVTERTIIVLRVTRTNATIVQRISLAESNTFGDGGELAIDRNTNKLYVCTPKLMRTIIPNNEYIIREYDIPSIDISSATITANKIVATIPYHQYTPQDANDYPNSQGLCFDSGKIFICVGRNTIESNRLYVVDAQTGALLNDIWTGRDVYIIETEGIAIYKGIFYQLHVNDRLISIDF